MNTGGATRYHDGRNTGDIIIYAYKRNAQKHLKYIAALYEPSIFINTRFIDRPLRAHQQPLRRVRAGGQSDHNVPPNQAERLRI